MRSAASFLALGAVVGLLGACTFDGATPPGARITCTASDECPPDMRCAGLISTCVADDGDSTAPEATVSLSAELLPRDGTLSIDIEPHEPLALTPQVQAGDLRRAADEDGDQYRVTFSATELGAGTHAAFAVLVDESGNVGLVTLGTVTVDVVDPALDLDVPIGWRITPPAGVVVAAPTRVTLGSRVDVGFEVSEVLSEEPTVVARGPEERAFSFLGYSGGVSWFTLEITEPLVAGEYQVSADLVDLAGNAARVDVPLPPPGFIADEVVPSPCVAVDESGAPQCTDFDGDDAFGLSLGCTTPAPFDCDDTDPTTYTAAPEVPGDAKDNDCAGDGDLPLDESTAVFADPSALAGGDGTRAAPFNDLFVATAASNAAAKVLALRSGDFGDQPAGWVTQHTVVGGLDADWSVDPLARTRMTFVTGRDTVFPDVEPHLYVGLALSSLNSLIDTSLPVTLLHCTLDAAERAIFTADRVTLIDVEVVGGFIEAASVHLTNSRLRGGDLFTSDGLILRSTLEVQVGVGDGGELQMVSSSLWSRGRDRGFSVGGKLRLYGSSVRVLGANENDPEPPAVFDLLARDVIVVASAVESDNAIVNLTSGALDVRGAALVAACAIASAGACVLEPDAADCGGALGCQEFRGVVRLDDLAPLPGDPHRLSASALAGPGPSLLEEGAPTSAAGDLDGRCRDTSAPGLGANELE